MKLKEALEQVADARKAGWADVTVGPEDPHLKDRDDCFVVGVDPKDKQRKRYGTAPEAPVAAAPVEAAPVEAKPEPAAH